MYCCATSTIRKDWTDYGGDHTTQAFTSDTCPVMCNTFEHLVFAQDTYLRIFTWTRKSFGSHREDFHWRKVLQTGWEKVAPPPQLSQCNTVEKSSSNWEKVARAQPAPPIQSLLPSSPSLQCSWKQCNQVQCNKIPSNWIQCNFSPRECKIYTVKCTCSKMSGEKASQCSVPISGCIWADSWL